MVNLRGAAKGLGQGLVYLGQQGLERQQRAENDQRLLDREMAMEAARQRIRNQDADTASDRRLKDAALETPIAVNRSRETTRANLEEQEPYREREDERTATREAARDTRQNREWDRRQQIEFDQWRQRLGITEDTERSRELWRRDQGLGANRQAQRLVRDGTSGHYISIDSEGNQTDTGISFPTSGDDDDILGEDSPSVGRTIVDAARGGRNGRPVLAAPRPTGRGRNTPPVAGARRAADGNWYVTRNGRNYRVDP